MEETSTPPPGAEATAPAEPIAAGPPADDDDTRSIHLRRLARHPVTLSLTITLAIACFVIGTITAGAAIGGAVAAGALLVAAGIVWAIANARAKEDFYNAYAQARGLGRAGRGPVPPLTPLLRRGDDRYAVQQFQGTLPGGEPGTLAHFTYEDTHTDSEGDRTTTYYNFTIAMCQVPEAAYKTSELYLQRRVGFRFMDGFEDVFRTKQRVEVESVRMDQRFETFADPNTDPNWIRQLFTPTFIDWLGDHSPENFAFELVAGGLVTNAKGHLDNSAALDEFCEATAAVAKRIRDESREQPVGGAPPPADAAPPAV